MVDLVGFKILLFCDVEDIVLVDVVFDCFKEEWGIIDFFVYVIGFFDKNELKGKYVDILWDNFFCIMVILCFLFIEIIKWVVDLMLNGGLIIILIYGGLIKVMLNYNVMGVVKVVLEFFVCYLVVDYGE